MPSDRPMKLPRLVHRVAWAGAASAALGGLLASVVSGGAADAWVERSEDRELSRLVAELADELDEELEEAAEDDSPEEHRHFEATHGARTLDHILTHELEEVRLRAPRAVVRGQEGVLAGDATLPDPAPGECTVAHGATPLRVCSSLFERGRVALATSAEGRVERRTGFGWAVLGGALAAAILGGLGSLFAASWALRPLEDLRRHVRSIRPDAPRLGELERSASYLELEELRQAVADLVERLSSALDQARAFAAQAAHELRTPLATLRAEVELLVERRADLAELRAVETRLRQLAELVERLLTLATPGADLQHEGRAVDLADVLAAALARLPDARGRVEVETMEDPVVRGDERLLASLLENALDNALKFSKGADDERVTVEVFARDGAIVLRVTDHGIGMSGAEREKAALPFYRSPAARAGGFRGHGVGVALMDHVVRAHGGVLRYLPTQRGTTLDVELPRFS
jgi:signal transduction histidine kinase